ncbi:MAG: hypothetical protein NTW29_10610 [Bacteroidetes bacterium]|nr:hypothetical protein [Bacteroidota bacterium]
MHKLLLAIFLWFASFANGQTNSEKDCKTTVELDVVIDTLYKKPSSPDTLNEKMPSGIVDRVGYCNPCYVLRPLNSNYRVVSYVIEAEDNDNNINEARVLGNGINYTSGSYVIRQAKKGEAIWFSCIRAIHTNGKTYTLRPFSIRMN